MNQRVLFSVGCFPAFLRFPTIELNCSHRLFFKATALEWKKTRLQCIKKSLPSLMTEKRALPKIPFFYWNLTRKITTRVPNQSRASTKYRKHLWPHQCRQTSLEVAELLLKKLPRPLQNKGNGPRYWRWVANHGVLIRLRLTKTGVCRYSLIRLKPTKNLFIGSTRSDSCGST